MIPQLTSSQKHSKIKFPCIYSNSFIFSSCFISLYSIVPLISYEVSFGWNMCAQRSSTVFRSLTVLPPEWAKLGLSVLTTRSTGVCLTVNHSTNSDILSTKRHSSRTWPNLSFDRQLRLISMWIRTVVGKFSFSRESSLVIDSDSSLGFFSSFSRTPELLKTLARSAEPKSTQKT